MTLATGTKLGRYEISSPLGAGGMGEVYLASDMELGRKVALKILPEELAANQDRMRRFEQEAKAAAALNHPSIAHIYEFGESNGTNFIAMEYIDGEMLRRRMQAAQMTVHEAIDVAIQVSSALSSAHEASIVHRDVKPENIMLCRRDQIVKVLDFGLAKLIDNRAISTDTEAATRAMINTGAGTIMGTVSYMSPEQTRGRDVDARSDIWSLGVLIYEMVAGRLPFDGETASDIMASILKTEPPPLSHYAADAPAKLEEIVAKALEKDREERYQTARDMLVDLRRLKKRLDFESEMERSVWPESSSHRAVVQTSGVQAAVDTSTEMAAQTSGAAAPTTSSAEYLVGEVKKHKSAFITAFLVLLVAVGGSSFWYFSNRSSNPKQIESVAVLPLFNESGNPDNEYLTDGVTESLIVSLSKIPNLNVKARSSVFRYKGKETDARTVARELNVQAILTGRIVQRGNDLTLYIELVDANTENVLWKETYIRPMANLATLQSEIVRDVSEKLRPKLSGVDEQRVAKKYTANSAAYQEYLKGRFYTLQYTPDGHKKAIEHLNEAIHLDPNFALAWAGLADAYTAASDWLLAPREALAKARAAAEKALAMDDTLAEAHAALGHVFVHQFNPTAESELQRALDLNPNSVEARLWYGEYSIGRPDEAKGIAVLRQAQELDPLSPVIGQFIISHYYYNRQFDEALIEAQKTLQLDPNDPMSRGYLAFVYSAKGNHAEAIAILEDLKQKLPISQMLGQLGMEYALTGRRNDALKIIAMMNELSKQQYVSPYDLAVVYTALGDKDQAFAWLEKAREDQSEWMGWLRFDARFDSLRSDPRFADLQRRLGLAP